jgi:hypothetical protein
MLTEPADRPLRLGDPQPATDRTMLLLQYVTAFVALAAAALLALVS